MRDAVEGVAWQRRSGPGRFPSPSPKGWARLPKTARRDGGDYDANDRPPGNEMMSRHATQLTLILLGLTILGTATSTRIEAQSRRDRWGWGGYRGPPRFPDPDRAPDHLFSFTRILYQSTRREALGQGWRTDYPGSDINFMVRFAEFTTASVSQVDERMPNHVVVTLTDDRIFDYPFAFMSDVGTVGFTDEEALRLRDYLLRGGFLYVDDFWGNWAWEQWSSEIGKALPPMEYPIFDLPLDHPIFHQAYEVPVVPQIPSIQFWRTYGGTSERGQESITPHLRGINDRNGRLMVVMSHNTDIADGWEREGEEFEFFHRFSADAYAVGMNVLLYAMTH
jgi:Domain of unknown function (DUF4159)